MEKSLKELFKEGISAKDSIALSTERFDSPQFLSTVQKAAELLEQCQKLVQKLGLYSDNEEIDDLTTTSLEYLMIDYDLATVFERFPKSLTLISKEEALKTLQRTAAAYLNFIKKLYDYKILEKEGLKQYEELSDIQATGSLSSRQSLAQQLANSARTRQEKIQQFKLEKNLQQQIEALSNSKDEESKRQGLILNLRLHSFKAFNALESLKMEKTMLEQAPEPRSDSNVSIGGFQPSEDERERQRENLSSSGYRVDQQASLSRSQPLLSSKGKVNRPFMLVNSREQVKKGIFGTGQYLPTMTVEEYLDEELKRGGIIKGGGNQSQQSDSSDDEDNNEKSDAKTYKARQWDEFTEQNPRGSGNTLNRG